MSRAAIALLVCSLCSVSVAPTPAFANGSLPAPLSVTTQPGNDQRIVLGLTFGSVISTDDADTWRWTCEANMGWTGIFYPVFAMDAAGTIYVSNPDGLSLSRDLGCNFAKVGPPLAGRWVSDVIVASDGAVWVATAASGANDVYVSHDGGVSFAATGLAQDAFFKNVRVAPGDPQRVYVSGYRTVTGPPPTPVFYRSLDGGGTWTELPFKFAGATQLGLLAVSPLDPDVLFARVDEPTKDHVLRSTDGGESWTDTLVLDGNIAGFTGTGAAGTTWVAGTVTAGVRVSTDDGLTWAVPSYSPQMACLGPRSDGQLFSCGANWNPDHFALGRSLDAADTWSKVFRYCEIDDQLQCAGDSTHAVKCDALWPGIRRQFAACAAPPGDGGVSDGPVADATAADATHTGDGGGDPCPPGCGCGISLGLAGFAAASGGRRRRGPPASR